MTLRPFWQFYKDCFPFIIGFSIISFFLFGGITALVVLLTISHGIGFLAFYILKRQEFYFYYNLGLSKLSLFISLCIYNLVLAIPFGILLMVLKLLGFGNTSLI